MDALRLERSKEALHGRVIQTVAASAHRLLDAMPLQHRPIRTRGVLRSAIRMMDEPPWRSAALEGHDQSVDAEPRLEMLRHRPADDLARGQILDGRQVQKALIGWNVRDVGQPHGVGSLGHKGAAEQVRRHRQVMAAVRGFGLTPLATAGLQTHVAHQPLDPASRMPVPFPAQFGVDPGRAVDPPLGRKDAADMPPQLGFRLSPALSGWDRAQPGVKAGDACADDPAQRRNGMVGALGCHKGKLGHAIPLAKKAAALRKIKFSSWSRFTSRLRRSISASSAFFWARASAEPAASCSLRHWLSWPGLTSSSAAMSASGLPLSITR